MEAEKISIRKFARALDVADTNIRNYIDKGTKPSSDVIEKILRVFPRTNPAWMIMGEGEPFLNETAEPLINYQKNNYGNSVGKNSGTVAQHHGTTGGEDASAAALALAQKEIALLHQQLEMKDAVIAAKEETITVMRATIIHSASSNSK